MRVGCVGFCVLHGAIPVWHRSRTAQFLGLHLLHTAVGFTACHSSMSASWAPCSVACHSHTLKFDTSLSSFTNVPGLPLRKAVPVLAALDRATTELARGPGSRCTPAHVEQAETTCPQTGRANCANPAQWNLGGEVVFAKALAGAIYLCDSSL